MPLVSVIIPAWNAVDTLPATLGAVLQQSHADLEVIVVDDGSTDGTAALTRAVEDPRVRLASFENGGQAAARNRGIEAAGGEYLAFLDADDLWTADKLETQLAALAETPGADAAYSWTDYIDEQGRPVRTGSHLSRGGDVLEAIFQVNFVESGSNLLVRRAAVERVGGFAAQLVPAEDWDWNLRLAERAHFVCVPRVQVLYRIRSTSQSSDVERMLRACSRCLEEALERNPRLAAASPSAFANIHRYLLYKLLEHAPVAGRAPGTFRRAARLVRAMARHDRPSWRRRETRRALCRALALTLLPGPWVRRIDRRETKWTRRVARRLSIHSLLDQILVR